MKAIAPGVRCKIVSVHHPAFNDRIGQHVIITRLDHSSQVAWAYDDKPTRCRINRAGRKVTVYTPQSIQTLYGVENLQVAADQRRESNNEVMV